MSPVQSPPFGVPLARIALRRVRAESPPRVFAFFEQMAARARSQRAEPQPLPDTAKR